MSGSLNLNKATLIGNLGKDPEIRTFQNGGRAASFSIATSESWKDKDSGERKERAEWHRNFDHHRGPREPRRKVSQERIQGLHRRPARNPQMDRQRGTQKYTTEIVLRPYSGELLMLDGRKDENGGATLAPPEEHEAVA